MKLHSNYFNAQISLCRQYNCLLRVRLSPFVENVIGGDGICWKLCEVLFSEFPFHLPHIGKSFEPHGGGNGARSWKPNRALSSKSTEPELHLHCFPGSLSLSFVMCHGCRPPHLHLPHFTSKGLVNASLTISWADFGWQTHRVLRVAGHRQWLVPGPTLRSTPPRLWSTDQVQLL